MTYNKHEKYLNVMEQNNSSKQYLVKEQRTCLSCGESCFFLFHLMFWENQSASWPVSDSPGSALIDLANCHLLSSQKQQVNGQLALICISGCLCYL